MFSYFLEIICINPENKNTFGEINYILLTLHSCKSFNLSQNKSNPMRNMHGYVAMIPLYFLYEILVLKGALTICKTIKPSLGIHITESAPQTKFVSIDNVNYL